MPAGTMEMSSYLVKRFNKLKVKTEKLIEKYTKHIDKVRQYVIKKKNSNDKVALDLNKDFWKLYDCVRDYIAPHEMLFEELSLNKRLLDSSWLAYLIDEPKTEFSHRLYAFYVLADYLISNGYIDPGIRQVIHPASNGMYTITRRYAWRRMSKPERHNAIEQYRTIGFDFPEFRKFERLELILSRPNLRKLINYALPSDADKDQFVCDYFAETYRMFSKGMTSTDKINLLLERNDTGQIFKTLKQMVADPVRMRLLIKKTISKA